jgi:hypothetical protein
MLGKNANLLETLTYEKGHQESSPGGHSFSFLNVSINKKPVFFSEVVIYKNIAHLLREQGALVRIQSSWPVFT